MSHDVLKNASAAGSLVLRRPMQSRQRTYQTLYQGQKAWVKQADKKTILPLAPLFQSLVQTPFMPEILRGTFIFDRVKALAFEATRLRHLEGRGHPVPRILDQTPERLILSDTGLSVWSLLRSSAGRNTMMAETMGIALAGLHEAGDFHGQPYPKNLTHNGKTISFIDLEDDTESVMSLKDAQLRDVWLMAHGCWPFAKTHPVIAACAVNAYATHTPGAVRREMVERLGAMKGTYAKLVHAGFGGKVTDNLRRYAWTYASVDRGLRQKLTA